MDAKEATYRLNLTIGRAYKWRTAQLGYKIAESERPLDKEALAVIQAALDERDRLKKALEDIEDDHPNPRSGR